MKNVSFVMAPEEFQGWQQGTFVTHGARLDGFTVGFGLAQTALGAEAHSAAAPRKIFVIHIISILFDGCVRFASSPQQ